MWVPHASGSGLHMEPTKASSYGFFAWTPCDSHMHTTLGPQCDREPFVITTCDPYAATHKYPIFTPSVYPISPIHSNPIYHNRDPRGAPSWEPLVSGLELTIDCTLTRYHALCTDLHLVVSNKNSMSEAFFSQILIKQNDHQTCGKKL